MPKGTLNDAAISSFRFLRPPNCREKDFAVRLDYKNNIHSDFLGVWKNIWNGEHILNVIRSKGKIQLGIYFPETKNLLVTNLCGDFLKSKK